MLLDNIASILKQFVRSRRDRSREVTTEQPVVALKSIGFDDFLAINMPPREMLLDPIFFMRHGVVSKTLLALSMGLAVASGSPFLRWQHCRL